MKIKTGQSRIPKHKVPNLMNNQLKFSQTSTPKASFFYKVHNSFRILENPLKSQTVYVSQGSFMTQKPLITQKTFKSKGKHRLLQSKSVDQAKTLQHSANKYLPKRKSHRPLLSTLDSIDKQFISGSRLAPMPLEFILEEKKKIQEKKMTKTPELMSQVGSNDKNQSESDDLQDFRPPEKSKDLKMWAQSIVNGQQNLYNNYDKRIMEKTRLYRRKKRKFNYKNYWK